MINDNFIEIDKYLFKYVHGYTSIQLKILLSKKIRRELRLSLLLSVNKTENI